MTVSRRVAPPEPGSRGQSTVMGFALILAIVLGSIMAVVMLGSAALADTQHQSELERAELSMTLFDSRAAMVALGTSDSQRVQFGQDAGRFETRPTDGWIALDHVNYTDGETEEIFNRSLGAVVYTNQKKEIAYQGGGVWRLGESGSAQMLSPPEFHFRKATLTLPIVRVTGEGSSAGATTARVGAGDPVRLVFPNGTDGSANGTGSPYDYNGDGRPYLNPVKNGTVQVTVHSAYYEAWASYFRDRTTGDIDVHHGNQTVSLELISLAGSIGQFPMPSENEGVEIRGMGSDHPITNYEVTLSEGHTGGGENHWAMYTTEGYNELEIHVEPDFGSCEARISVFYANASTGEHQEWQTGFLTGSSDAISCDSGNMTIEFTSDTDDIEYRDIQGTTGSGTKFCFGEKIRDNSPDSPANLDQHSVDPGSITPNDGHTESLNFSINHYLSRLGTDHDLVVKDAQGNFCPGGSGGGGGGGRGSDSVDEDASVGVLEFAEAEGAQYITYLHITENEIEVNLG